VGTRTDAAHAEAVAARDGLGEELVRLEASARAAVDIPARIRREPVKVAGSAAGAAFLLLGGPRRLIRGVRHAILGPTADLPKAMLPDEVDKALRRLGPDGDKVRGTLEREFAGYLKKHSKSRRERDFGAAATGLLTNLLKPASVRLGRQLAEQMLDPDGPSFAEGLGRARARVAGADRADGSGAPADTGGPKKRVSAKGASKGR
jgi:hypothetical protein